MVQSSIQFQSAVQHLQVNARLDRLGPFCFQVRIEHGGGRSHTAVGDGIGGLCDERNCRVIAHLRVGNTGSEEVESVEMRDGRNEVGQDAGETGRPIEIRLFGSGQFR